MTAPCAVHSAAAMIACDYCVLLREEFIRLRRLAKITCASGKARTWSDNLSTFARSGVSGIIHEALTVRVPSRRSHRPAVPKRRRVVGRTGGSGQTAAFTRD